MKCVDQAAQLREQIRQWRTERLRIGFVPTMGNLHQGHLTLVKTALQHADKVVVSIFVNPMQFERADDLANYPRTLQQDIDQLASAGADLLFTPSADLIYPNGLQAQTFVEVPGLSDALEGALRPGHFRGVATIVTKLFNLVQPDLACFGEKDFQQLAVIRQMVTDLSMPIEIIGVPTVRDANGLALSSRNNLLSEQQYQLAPALAKQMHQLGAALKQSPEQAETLIASATAQLNAQGFNTDRIDVVDADTLTPLTSDSSKAVILMAAYLGTTRLIDNLVVALD